MVIRILNGNYLVVRIVEVMLLIVLSATVVGTPIIVLTKFSKIGAYIAGAVTLALTAFLYSTLGPAKAILVLLLPIAVALCISLCLCNRYESMKKLAQSTLISFFTSFSLLMAVGTITSVMYSYEEMCVEMSFPEFLVSMVMLAATVVVYSFIGAAIWQVFDES